MVASSNHIQQRSEHAQFERCIRGEWGVVEVQLGGLQTHKIGLGGKAATVIVQCVDVCSVRTSEPTLSFPLTTMEQTDLSWLLAPQWREQMSTR